MQTQGGAPLNKTIGATDLEDEAVAAAARPLKRLARWMWWRGVPFAVNGALRRRFWIHWHKLWEYSRGLAYGGFQPGMRVLDFGGAATLPVFHLAREGCEVLTVDIDARLSDHAQATAAAHGWNLRSSTVDLTQGEPPAEWGAFDRVVSFCVIEHIRKDLQRRAVERLASLVKPGGLFELTFDFGEDAPVGGAIRTLDEVDELIAASGLQVVGNREFLDTGERFRLDKKYPRNRFTFGSLFLRKPS